jgi:tetratricopeptide (TPR) repeat protein
MSLLLDALKKAERAKQEAEQRSREGAGALRLEGEAGAPDRPVVTRDELPPITSPLDIQSEDLRAEPPRAQAAELSLQEAAPPPPPRGGPEPQAAQRATARKVFDAKVREPNPRLPFYIAVGALGAFAVGTAIYFYIQLRPPPPLYNPNPKPQAGELAVAPAPAPSAPLAQAAPPAPAASIPGLPPVQPRPLASAAQPPRATPPEKTRPAPRAEARPRPRPAPRQAAPAPAPRAAAPVATHRPPPRVHPRVSAGYAAYQAGDMDRARSEYEQALLAEPGNRDALLGLAAVDTRAGRYENADALYRRLLEADPRDAHAHAGLLALRAQQIDPVAAESRLKGLIAAGTGESVLYFTLGNQYAQQRRWPEAQQAYARAAAIDPENPDFAYNLAVSLEHLRQPQGALGQYRRALALGLQRPSNFDPAAVQSRVQQLER